MKVGRPAGGRKNPNMKHNDDAHKSIVNRQRWFIRNIIGPRERHHKLSDLFDCLRTNWTWNRRSLGSDKLWYSFALLLINSIFEYPNIRCFCERANIFTGQVGTEQYFSVSLGLRSKTMVSIRPLFLGLVDFFFQWKKSSESEKKSPRNVRNYLKLDIFRRYVSGEISESVSPAMD